MGRGRGRLAPLLPLAPATTVPQATIAGVLVGALALAAGGCAGKTLPPSPAAAAVAPEIDGRAGAIQLAEDVRRALGRIAVTDPRFAKRLGARPSDDELRVPAVKALAEGDTDVSIRDGALDFFSFTARARGLEEARGIVERAPLPAADAKVTVPSIARLALERELALRVVAEERARLEEERSLPRGASALVRGIVDTWSPPASVRAAAERDQWLTARLDQIGGSLAGATLPRAALLELDDALDPLERLAQPESLPSAAGAVARLRIKLGETSSSSLPGTRQAQVEAGVRAHLGLSLGAKDLRTHLEEAERATRALAKESSRRAEEGGKSTEAGERAIAKRAEELTLSAGTCDAPAADSRVRSMMPPSERAPICGALRATEDAKDDVELAASLVALHDATVVALWALALHAEGAPPERAIASVNPFFGAQPEREAHLIRFAEANPVAALGAGLAAELLTRGGASAADAGARGKRWLAFGDAPLDVIERELFAAPAASAAASSAAAPGLTSAPARPASPRP
jgi:hypothetical protein